MVASTYKLRVADDLAQLLRTLHPDLKRKIKASLAIILDNPEVGKSLRDELTGLKSFRVGRVRIIYRIKSRTIELVAVGPRKKIYEETYRLIKKK